MDLLQNDNQLTGEDDNMLLKMPKYDIDMINMNMSVLSICEPMFNLTSPDLMDGISCLKSPAMLFCNFNPWPHFGKPKTAREQNFERVIVGNSKSISIQQPFHQNLGKIELPGQQPNWFSFASDLKWPQISRVSKALEPFKFWNLIMPGSQGCSISKSQESISSGDTLAARILLGFRQSFCISRWGSRFLHSI